MLFEIPQDITDYLGELDAFIEREIKPLQAQDDNERFFDHRREHARTDWDNQGLPRHDWEDLLRQMRQLADKAGHLRYALPKEYGGQDGTNLAMAVIRDGHQKTGQTIYAALADGRHVAATIGSTVFYDPEGKRHHV